MGKVASEVLGRHIEHENQHFDILEDVLALSLEILFHEHILTTAVPEGEYQVAQEADTMLVHIDGESDTIGVTSQIVCENN